MQDYKLNVHITYNTLQTTLQKKKNNTKSFVTLRGRNVRYYSSRVTPLNCSYVWPFEKEEKGTV